MYEGTRDDWFLFDRKRLIDEREHFSGLVKYDTDLYGICSSSCYFFFGKVLQEKLTVSNNGSKNKNKCLESAGVTELLSRKILLQLPKTN